MLLHLLLVFYFHYKFTFRWSRVVNKRLASVECTNTSAGHDNCPCHDPNTVNHNSAGQEAEFQCKASPQSVREQCGGQARQVFVNDHHTDELSDKSRNNDNPTLVAATDNGRTVISSRRPYPGADKNFEASRCPLGRHNCRLGVAIEFRSHESACEWM